MKTDKMVTRCPQCGTSFRITPAQLQSARGAVRCGACLHIFKARDHLVGAKAPQPSSALVRKPRPTPQANARPEKPVQPPKPSSKPSTPTRAPQRPPSPTDSKPAGAPRTTAPQAKTRPDEKAQLQFDQSLIDSELGKLDDDDFLISDDMDQMKPGEDDPFGIGEATKNRHSLFERKAEREQDSDKTADDTDESWAMSLLEDEEEEASGLTPQSGPQESARKKTQFEETTPSFELIEEPTKAQLDEGQLEEAPTEDQLQFHMDEPDDAESPYQDERLRAHNPERSALLMNIDPEPVEMTWTRQRQQDRRRKWLWGALAVTALFALTAQVAWLQFDRLSRVEPYRSVYGALCPILGCQLPTLVDRSQIRAYNLVVRNHPERDGALIVDAILLNTAGFAQPFPELVLEFSDLSGAALAAREFTPEEYLSGELAGRTSMPPNQPVHLTLELVDPGEDAVNYRAYIPD